MLEEIDIPKQLLTRIPEVISVLTTIHGDDICIAGGFPADLFFNTINLIEKKNTQFTYGDIDVFCSKKSIVSDVDKILTEFGYGKVHTTTRAISYTNSSKIIQVILPYDDDNYPRLHESFEQHVIDYFDFTCCQVILTSNNTLKCSQSTINSIIEQKIEPTDMGEIHPKRVEKYIKKGFTLSSGILFMLSSTLSDPEFFENLESLY
jgi:hypothetical protein